MAEHILSDQDAKDYLAMGINAQEVVRLRWPDVTDEQAAYVLWERTPYPLIQGIHDIADRIADLEEDAFSGWSTGRARLPLKQD